MADQKQTAPVPPVPAPDPPLTLDSLKEAIREVLGEFMAEATLAETADPADVDLTRRTIRHNMFAYDTPEGGQAIAMRGDTVEVMPHDLERGERFGAFTARVGVMPEPGGSILPDYPIDGDAAEVEQDAWVKAGTIEEIMLAVAAHPEIAGSVMAAEQRRSVAARKTLLQSLGDMAAL